MLEFERSSRALCSSITYRFGKRKARTKKKPQNKVRQNDVRHIALKRKWTIKTEMRLVTLWSTWAVCFFNFLLSLFERKFLVFVRLLATLVCAVLFCHFGALITFKFLRLQLIVIVFVFFEREFNSLQKISWPLVIICSLLIDSMPLSHLFFSR